MPSADQRNAESATHGECSVTIVKKGKELVITVALRDVRTVSSTGKTLILATETGKAALDNETVGATVSVYVPNPAYVK